MAIFTTNQVRHFYVANADKTSGEIINQGDFSVNTTNDGKYLYFKTKTPGGLLRSDLIEIKNIMYAKSSNATNLARHLKKATITLNSELNGGNIVAGSEYIMNLKIKGQFSLSEDPAIWKYGIVHTTTGMTASDFYKKMALSLVRNFSRQDTPMIKVELTTSSGSVEVNKDTKADSLTGTYTNIVLTEIEQEWILGAISQRPVDFEVNTDIITYQGEEYLWGTVEYSQSVSTLHNGKRIADMEYFYMGERGDIYRETGTPNRIYTTYMVDSSKPYHVLDIHYAFVDSDNGVQKSEKDIIIVSSDSVVLNAIIDEINSVASLAIKSV